MKRDKLYNILVNNYFSPREARALSAPRVNQYSSRLQDPDVIWKSGLIQKAIKSRRSFVLNCKAQGYNSNQIKKAISAFYKGQMGQLDSSPMKFLRIEYAVTPSHVTNYALSTKLREREQVNRVAKVMGVKYGRKSPIAPKVKSELFVIQPQYDFLDKI